MPKAYVCKVENLGNRACVGALNFADFYDSQGGEVICSAL